MNWLVGELVVVRGWGVGGGEGLVGLLVGWLVGWFEWVRRWLKGEGALKLCLVAELSVKPLFIGS